MTEAILNYYKKVKKYKDTTIKIYTKHLVHIFKEVLKVKQYKLEYLISEKEDILEFISGLDKTSSQKIYLNSILSILDDDDYHKMLKSVSLIHKRKRNYKKFTRKEMFKYRSLETLYNRILNKEKNKSIDIILASLYIIFPPLRGQDYYNLKYGISTKGNYYYKGSMVIREFKTDKIYDKRVLKLPIIIKRMLEEYLIDRKQGNYVFLNRYNKKYNQSAFSKKITYLFEGININLLRKIYISEVLHALKGSYKNIKLRKKLAIIMGHSLQTQEFTYKINNNIHYSSKNFMDYVLRVLNNI